MRHSQSGFTLIELVIVIVILGVLAALAVPRFVNLSDDAEAAALKANASAINSAMSINYAACAVVNFTVGGECVAVNNCDDAASVLNGGALPAGYTVAATAITGAANGSTETCTVTQTSTTNTKTFTAIRTAPNA